MRIAQGRPIEYNYNILYNLATWHTWHIWNIRKFRHLTILSIWKSMSLKIEIYKYLYLYKITLIVCIPSAHDSSLSPYAVMKTAIGSIACLPISWLWCSQI